MKLTTCVLALTMISFSTLIKTEPHPPASLRDSGTIDPSGESVRAISSQNQPASMDVLEVSRSDVVMLSAEEPLSAVQSCTTDARDIAEPPSGADIDALLYRYSATCHEKLYSTLESIYADEGRDQLWASPLEEKIKGVAATVPGLTIRGNCHSSLCRFDFEFPNAKDRGPLLRDFDRSLISLLNGTRLAVSIVYFATPHGYIKYFASDVPPAAFVGPLRLKMDDRKPATTR